MTTQFEIRKKKKTYKENIHMPHDRSYAAMQREKNCIFANMYTLQNTQKKVTFFLIKTKLNFST